MKDTKQVRAKFLEVMDKPDLTKDQIFKALFDACDNCDAVDTRHVFFQDVIVKFNAQKARNLINSGSKMVNESHYVDVALGAYIKSGYPLKDFDKDLKDYKQMLMPSLFSFGDGDLFLYQPKDELSKKTLSNPLLRNKQ